MERNWKTYYAALAAFALGGGMGVAVPDLGAGDVRYDASFNYTLPATLVVALDGFAAKAAPEEISPFEWTSFGCARAPGTIDGSAGMVTMCALKAPTGELALSLPTGATKILDDKIGKAKPGLSWESIDCVRKPGTVDGKPQLVTSCRVSGGMLASSLSEVPDGATIRQ